MQLICVKRNLFIDIKLWLFASNTTLCSINTRKDSTFIHAHDDFFSQSDYFENITKHFKHWWYVYLCFVLSLLWTIFIFMHAPKVCKVWTRNRVLSHLSCLFYQQIINLSFINTFFMKSFNNFLSFNSRKVKILHWL